MHDDLLGMSDPEFFRHWSSVRTRYALTPPDSEQRDEAQREYRAVLAEYRRRTSGMCLAPEAVAT